MKVSTVLGFGLIPLLLILFIRGAEYAARIRYNVPETGSAVLITGALCDMLRLWELQSTNNRG